MHLQEVAEKTLATAAKRQKGGEQLANAAAKKRKVVPQASADHEEPAVAAVPKEAVGDVAEKPPTKGARAKAAKLSKAQDALSLLRHEGLLTSDCCPKAATGPQFWDTFQQLKPGLNLCSDNLGH